jgi:hypothetical protein
VRIGPAAAFPEASPDATREIDDARVWAGLHWRHSMRHGAKIGREVARHVSGNFFQPIP